MSDALNSQIDGNHYKLLKMQPLELAYLVGGTPCFTKLAKYVSRDKGDKLINLDKAIHCIKIEQQINETSTYHLLDCYPTLSSYAKRDQAQLIINMYSDNPFIQAALKAMLDMQYDVAIAEVEALKRSFDDN